MKCKSQIIVFILLITLTFAICMPIQHTACAVPPIGYDISELSTTDIYGNTISWSDIAGDNYTLIMLWSQYATNVTSALASMQAAYETYSAQGVSVIGMLYESEQTYAHIAQEYYQKFGIDFPTLRYVYDPILSGLVDNSYGYMPVYYIVDNNGIVVDYSSTYLTSSRLNSFINKYLPNYHVVQFVDIDKTIIFESVVSTGTNVYPPTPPTHEGLAFIEWDGEYIAVTSDRIILAVYGIIGDTNSDGTVNTGDAIVIMKCCIGASVLPACMHGVADVNMDGQVNIGDAVYLLRRCIGLV